MTLTLLISHAGLLFAFSPSAMLGRTMFMKAALSSLSPDTAHGRARTADPCFSANSSKLSLIRAFLLIPRRFQVRILTSLL